MTAARFDLRHLTALDAVIRTRSFSRAAEELGYTQSAVSQQITQLERVLGARLLERSSGRARVDPTEAGARLQRHTKRIVASLQAAEADIAALSEDGDGRLRVGTFQSVGTSILPPLMRRFREAWPDVEVSLFESVSTRELLDHLERGELDLSFTLLPLEESLPFEASELVLDPFVLLVPPESPLAQRPHLPSREELAELVLVGYRHPGPAPNVETRLRSLGIAPRIVFRSDDNATIQGLVAAGVAAAVLPRFGVNFDDARVHLIDLAELMPPRVIGVVWHIDRYRSPAALGLEALARRVCEEMTADRIDRLAKISSSNIVG